MAKIEIEAGRLSYVVGALATIIPKKPSRDILKCFKIEAKDSPDALVLYAAGDHMETFASMSIVDGLVVKQSGEFVVPAKVFMDYVKALDADKVILETEEDSLVRLKVEGASFEVGLQDLDEFPKFPEVPSE